MPWFVTIEKVEVEKDDPEQKVWWTVGGVGGGVEWFDDESTAMYSAVRRFKEHQDENGAILWKRDKTWVDITALIPMLGASGYFLKDTVY